MSIPVLRTPRLILAGHVEADLDDLAAMWADPAVYRHIGGRAFTREEAWHRLQRYVGHWALKGYGLWTIRAADDGRFIGHIGFADFKRPLDPPQSTAPEAGWVLTGATHGQGYAGEALVAALAWLDASPHAGRTTALIDPANTPSIRLARRHDFVEATAVDYHGKASLLFERLSPACPSSRA